MLRRNVRRLINAEEIKSESVVTIGQKLKFLLRRSDVYWMTLNEFNSDSFTSGYIEMSRLQNDFELSLQTRVINSPDKMIFLFQENLTQCQLSQLRSIFYLAP